jgi:hypothetical protein
VEGMALLELAGAMSVSLATAKRHLQRAETELLALLGEDGQHIAPWLRSGLEAGKPAFDKEPAR